MENKKRKLQFLIVVLIAFVIFYYLVFPNWEGIKNFFIN